MTQKNTITPNQFKRMFPKATASAIKANCGTQVEITKEEIIPKLDLSESTDIQKLNKTEREFWYIIKSCSPWAGAQCMTLKLGDDCRYTPDFIVISDTGKMTAYEVKGFFRDDAKVKIKVAARMFPFITFTLVRKMKIGFEYENVNP